MNMAPLIDIVFLLLIFFMVATTYIQREKEMGVDLPSAASGAEEAGLREEIVINLMQDGRIIVDGKELSSTALVELLTATARQNADTPVTIRGDKKAVLESLVSIMDACRLAGLSNLGVMTRDS